jgi:hypothetical protein
MAADRRARILPKVKTPLVMDGKFTPTYLIGKIQLVDEDRETANC